MSNVHDIWTGMPIIHKEAFTEFELSELEKMAGQGNPLPIYPVQEIDCELYCLIQKYMEKCEQMNEIMRVIGALQANILEGLEL